MRPDLDNDHAVRQKKKVAVHVLLGVKFSCDENFLNIS